MLLETIGGDATPPHQLVYSGNPSQATAPLSINSSTPISNAASTGVGNSSGPVTQSGGATGMTRATESTGLSLQQTVQNIVNGISVQGMTGNQLNQEIASALSSSGLVTSDQVQSVLNNSGIVGTGTFTQQATAAQQAGWVNQVLAAINLTPPASAVPTDPTTNLPINNVASDPTTNPSTTVQTPTITVGNTTGPNTNNEDGTTVGDPPTATGSTPTMSGTPSTPVSGGTDTNTSGTGSVLSSSDPWATLLGEALQEGAGSGASIPQAPETPVATSTTSGGTSSGGSNTLLLLGVLAAGAGGLWYFMHKKHKDAQAKAA